MSRQTPVLDLFKSMSGIRESPSALLDIGDDDLDDRHTVQEEVPPPYIVICLWFHKFVTFSSV